MMVKSNIPLKTNNTWNKWLSPSKRIVRFPIRGPVAAPIAPNAMIPDVNRVDWRTLWLNITTIGHIGPEASPKEKTAQVDKNCEKFIIRTKVAAIIPRLPKNRDGSKVNRWGRMSIKQRPVIKPIHKMDKRVAAELADNWKCFSK